MFKCIKKLSRKNETNDIYAPVSGNCLDIAACSDKTFSSHMMGDGFMIEPEDVYICAPCDGILSMVFPTKHAFGIKMNNQEELLIHIGVETVNLAGNGFTFLSKVNKKIKRGERIMKCDFTEMRKQGYEVAVIVLVTGKDKLVKQHIGSRVTIHDVIIAV